MQLCREERAIVTDRAGCHYLVVLPSLCENCVTWKTHISIAAGMVSFTSQAGPYRACSSLTSLGRRLRDFQDFDLTKRDTQNDDPICVPVLCTDNTSKALQIQQVAAATGEIARNGAVERTRTSYKPLKSLKVILTKGCVLRL
jgi:hypothetical protein